MTRHEDNEEHGDLADKNDVVDTATQSQQTGNSIPQQEREGGFRFTGIVIVLLCLLLGLSTLQHLRQYWASRTLPALDREQETGQRTAQRPPVLVIQQPAAEPTTSPAAPPVGVTGTNPRGHNPAAPLQNPSQQHLADLNASIDAPRSSSALKPPAAESVVQAPIVGVPSPAPTLLKPTSDSLAANSSSPVEAKPVNSSSPHPQQNPLPNPKSSGDSTTADASVVGVAVAEPEATVNSSNSLRTPEAGLGESLTSAPTLNTSPPNDSPAANDNGQGAPLVAKGPLPNSVNTPTEPPLLNDSGEAHNTQVTQFLPQTPASSRTPDATSANASSGVEAVSTANASPLNGVRSIQARPGDTFVTLAEKFYHSPEVAQALFNYNRQRVAHPDGLTPGQIIEIPNLQALQSHDREPVQTDLVGATPSKPAPIVTARSTRGETHTVREGESLIEIAKRRLGAASRWSEIYRLNRQALGDAFDTLPSGLELRLPSENVATRREEPVLK